MLDIILVVCCILGGFAVGKYVESKIGEKGKFYKDLVRYVATLRDNVNGKQLELLQFNNEFAKSSCKSFAEYISTGKLRLRLSKAQRENVATFFDNLDCASSQALLQHLDYQGKILVEDGKSVLEREVAKASICSKLGMLLGAMIGILLV